MKLRLNEAIASSFYKRVKIYGDSKLGVWKLMSDNANVKIHMYLDPVSQQLAEKLTSCTTFLGHLLPM